MGKCGRGQRGHLPNNVYFDVCHFMFKQFLLNKSSKWVSVLSLFPGKKTR